MDFVPGHCSEIVEGDARPTSSDQNRGGAGHFRAALARLSFGPFQHFFVEELWFDIGAAILLITQRGPAIGGSAQP
jgi:hypothetical protein